MKYIVLCVTLSILFFINIVQSADDSDVVITPTYTYNDTKVVTYTLRASINLNCSIENLKTGYTVTWQRGNETLSNKDRIKMDSKNSLYKLLINDAQEADTDNYSCLVSRGGAEIARATLYAASAVAVKVAANINVVEEEVLKIHCLVKGAPKPNITWTYENDTVHFNFTETTDRFIVEESGTIVKIEHVQLYDRGHFTCIGTSPLTGQEDRSKCLVRVKDKYAALWPFLGICAEVIILCAIILIYEKKRNKSELEESDTDQSPDQKNTPDHGKESNLRHRQ